MRAVRGGTRMTDAERLRSLAGAQFGPTRAALLAGAAALEAQAGQEGEIARLRAALEQAIRGMNDIAAQARLCVDHLGVLPHQREWFNREVLAEEHGAAQQARGALLSRAGAEEGEG